MAGMPTDLKPPTDRIPATAWARTPQVVRQELVALVQELAEVKARLARAEEQLRRNSRNSSQPPSQDKPEQKAVAEADPDKSKRRRGGQAGHVGHRRPLVPLEAVDQVVVHRPTHCGQCGALLLGDGGQPYRHQVTELPCLKATITEHQVYSVTCLCCGATTRGELPPEVAASQFGPNLVSLMALLMGCYRLSQRQVADLLANCFTTHAAPSSVVNQQQVISQALAQPVDELQRYVQQQPACNVDETGWRQTEAKRGWLWVVVTTVVTVFHIAARRSGAIARQLLGDEYDGVVGTDRYSGYNWLDPSQRQLCWSHLLRDFQKILERGEESFMIGSTLQLLGETYTGVVGSDRASAYNWLDPSHRQVCWSHLLRDFQKILERGGDSYRIGATLKIYAEYLLVLWAHVRDGTSSYESFLAEFPAIQSQIRYWLAQGLLCPDDSTAETCRRLIALDTALWSFVTAPGVEPTNNAAERALRHPVIWRRTSRGTQSDQGRLFVQRMLTVAETCRRQRRPVFAFVRSALLAYRAGYPAPFLLPA
jgi:transposase